MTSEELKRYNRQIILDGVGLEGQQKLKSAKVLVVGAGGLGSPVLQYLSAAGIGTIGIIDADEVSLTNLQRQILFTTNDIGQNKAEVAAKKLAATNPHTDWKVYTSFLDESNALDIIGEYDLVVDGTDNFKTRYLINDACIIKNTPFVYGSILKYQGQVAVFNYKNGPSYRCLFPEPPEHMPTCSQIGVIGVLPGIIGSLQANEALKIILGHQETLSGKLLMYDLQSNDQQIISFHKNEENFKLTQLTDYSIYDNCVMVDSISVDELNEKLENYFVIDIRPEEEREVASIPNSHHIPQDRISESIDKIPRNQNIVVYCHYGHRSQSVANTLLEEYGFEKVYNLEGGIDEWSIEIDNSIDRY